LLCVFSFLIRFSIYFVSVTTLELSFSWLSPTTTEWRQVVAQQTYNCHDVFTFFYKNKHNINFKKPYNHIFAHISVIKCWYWTKIEREFYLTLFQKNFTNCVTINHSLRGLVLKAVETVWLNCDIEYLKLNKTIWT
jgi:uncharacterized protein with von Willebrand factor type A (vWA) domain